ncbi:hypothetical protein [Sphingomonas aracearum]|nr:hypothetical protein [Sphingomonas aracearum]
MTRARLTVAGSASGPARLCLTPHPRGDVLLRATACRAGPA